MASHSQSTLESSRAKAAGIFRAAGTASHNSSTKDNFIRVLSWNIRGRDDRYLAERSAAVYKVILSEAPDVVFLQEIVPVSWRAMKEAAAAASAEFSANDKVGIAKPVPRYGVVFGLRHYPYKCAVLLRQDVCQLIGRKTIQFPTSATGRNLLLVRARVRDAEFTLLTTHLESYDVLTEERQEQLRLSLMTLDDAPISQYALLGGDLNVRDRELAAVGGIPAGAVDVWRAVCGDQYPYYACETVHNNGGDNKGWKTCRRFDRFVFRPPKIPHRAIVQPTLYRTVGRERVASCGCFPSNHWGIVAQFSVQNGIKNVASQAPGTNQASSADAIRVPHAHDMTNYTVPSYMSQINDVIRVLSWNVDGLDAQNLTERSAEVYKVISSEAPDVVFLQELVPTGWRAMKEAGSEAFVAFSASSRITKNERHYGAVLGPPSYRYICTVLLRLDTCELIGRRTIPFPTSKVGRNLLLVRARVRGVEFTLLTTHLESFANDEDEDVVHERMLEKRRLQLRRSLMAVKDTPASQCALLGGDLKVPEWDVASVGGIPTGAVDVWRAVREDRLHRYTWDTTQNDNGGVREWRPRHRFDRFVFRPSKIPDRAVVQPTLFRTVGRERIASCGRFPSDHWGILAEFNVIT